MTEKTTKNELVEDGNLGKSEELENNREVDSKYRMILIAAQRTKQLQRGATARVTLDPAQHKNTRIALEEVKHNKVDFKITEEL
ncbi:MAG: DNA-directed RNA polymerase subunit omega [Pyrinomonadaceae bacterium]